MVSPLTQLTRKDQSFSWTKEEVDYCSRLALLDMTKAFKVYCDASYQGLGCVLIRGGKTGQPDPLVAHQKRARLGDSPPINGLDIVTRPVLGRASPPFFLFFFNLF